jgi:hypothetical protein
MCELVAANAQQPTIINDYLLIVASIQLSAFQLVSLF